MSEKKRRIADQPAKSPKRRRAPLLRVSLPGLHRIHPRHDAAGLALLFAGALVLYAASTPRTVMLEDDGGIHRHGRVRRRGPCARVSAVRPARLARLACAVRQRGVAGAYRQRPDGRAHLRVHRVARVAPHRQPARGVSRRRGVGRLRAFLVAGDHRRRLYHQHRGRVPDVGPRAGSRGAAAGSGAWPRWCTASASPITIRC